MPNWCNNNLQITGPNKIIDKIEKIVNDESSDAQGLLDYFHPMPKGLEGTTSPDSSADKPQPYIDGYTNWYDWCLNNWGTKWELCEYHGVDRKYLTLNSEGESTIEFAFESAWSPPINALAHWLEMNEECQATLSYYEGGCDFMGIWDNFDDSVYSPSDYKSDDAFWDKGIGKQLDEDFAITESMAQWEEEQKEEESA